MKTDHTPEPLHYMPLPAADGTFMVLVGQGQDYSLVASCTTEEDARRIVACVNACAGIGTEYLEHFGGTSFNDFKRVKGQRDELLAELEELSLYVAYNGDDWVQKKARAAIASVKEKA